MTLQTCAGCNQGGFLGRDVYGRWETSENELRWVLRDIGYVNGGANMRRLGIEQLTVLGLKPLEFVDIVADMGCDCLSTGLSGMPGYPSFSLREDVGLRREMIAAMRDRGVSISLGEGCIVRPGRDIRDVASDLDIFQELGAERINTVSMDPDLERSLDQFGVLAEMSWARGMASSVELSPNLTIGNLASAVAAVRHVWMKRHSIG